MVVLRTLIVPPWLGVCCSEGEDDDVRCIWIVQYSDCLRMVDGIVVRKDGWI